MYWDISMGEKNVHITINSIRKRAGRHNTLTEGRAFYRLSFHLSFKCEHWRRKEPRTALRLSKVINTILPVLIAFITVWLALMTHDVPCKFYEWRLTTSITVVLKNCSSINYLFNQHGILCYYKNTIYRKV